MVASNKSDPYQGQSHPCLQNHDIGEVVTLKGLTFHSELNGCEGIVVGPMNNSNGRYPVRLNPINESERTVFVSPQNIEKKKAERQSESDKDGNNKVPIAKAVNLGSEKNSFVNDVPMAKAVPIGFKNSFRSLSGRYGGASAPPRPSVSTDGHTSKARGLYNETTEGASATPNSSIPNDQTSFSCDDPTNQAHQSDASHNNNVEEGNKRKTSDPHHGIGCCKGFLRDRHTGIGICTVLYITCGALYAAYVINSELCAILCCVLSPFYTYLALFRSNTLQYLLKIVTTETAIQYINRMYEAAPAVCWHIQCYHYETRYYTYQEYNSSTGHYETKTGTRTVRVNTHSATGRLSYCGWKDVSTPIQQHDIEKHRLTKVLVNKYWVGDRGADAQKERFVNTNRCDVYYDFDETLSIPGYQKRYLGLNSINDRPFFLHWVWYILTHLTIVYAYPYLLYTSSVTDKVEVDVVKQIWTDELGPQSDISSHNYHGGTAESESRMSPSTPRVSRTEDRHARCFSMKRCFSCVGLLVYTFGLAVLALSIAPRALQEVNMKRSHPGCMVADASRIGDGICDGEDFNTEDCHWDGGDCVIEGYPDCHIDKPTLIGDGWCCCSDSCIYKDQVWTEECGWDGGDCEDGALANYTIDPYCPYS